jgi:histidinol-phosphatase (PHP family)
MHTPLCKHAKGEPEEYAAVAEQRGLAGIIVTCHNPTNDGWGARYRMDVDQFEAYVALVARARAAWAGRVDVRLGLECDYYPGAESWLEDVLGWAEFHHVLGSVHPDLAEYKERYFKGDVFDLQRIYYEHLAQAAETGLFDTLAHPDLVKNFEPAKWQVERLWPTIQRSLDRIAKTGVAMELNTSGLQKRLPEMNPGPQILIEMRERNIPVVIGADAHEPQRVAANYEDALNRLEEAGYSHISIFLNRTRQEMTLETARRSLKYPVA